VILLYRDRRGKENLNEKQTDQRQWQLDLLATHVEMPEIT
jgi:hypothetical protein